MGEVLFPCVVRKVTNPVLVIAPVFADNAWETIVKACQKNKVPDSWAVGDQKLLSINGSDYAIDIIGKNHDAYADGSGLAPLTFQLHDCYGITYRLQATTSNIGGWEGCEFRVKEVPSLIEVLPEVVRAGLRAVAKHTGGGSTNSQGSTTADKLFLLSEAEIFGPGGSEGVQYAYYAEGGSKIKTLNDTAINWWERSPNRYNASSFGVVRETGVHSVNSADDKNGIAFAFCF